MDSISGQEIKPKIFGSHDSANRGLYVIAEMDGLVFHQKVAKFHVIPYFACTKIKLPENLKELIRISEFTLKRIEETDEYEEVFNRDYSFEGIRNGERKLWNNKKSGDLNF